jgi:predicted molibdopterin-dependent oxidoreductase YjgC
MGKEIAVVSPAVVFAEIAQANPLYKGMVFDLHAPQQRDGSGEALLEKAAFGAIALQPLHGDKGHPFSLSIEGIFESHLIGSSHQQRAKGLAQVFRTYLAMNAEEARRIGVADGDSVRVVTPWGETVVAVKGLEGMRRDTLCLFLSFYDADASRLVGPEMDPHSLVPAYSGIPARLEKA